MTDFIKESQERQCALPDEAMPWFFYVHRSFSFGPFTNLWLVRLLVNSLGWMHAITRLTFGMIAVIGLSVLSGATLGHLGMPAFVQPTHLLAATLLFGLQFLIWLSYRHARTAIPSQASFSRKVCRLRADCCSSVMAFFVMTD